MSRTPTREAMLRLAGDGLVEVCPRHGMRVKPVSMVDMREMREMREMRATTHDMDAALERDDLPAWAEADERFHALLVSAAAKLRLTESVQIYVGQSHRVRMQTLRLRPIPLTANRDHENVVDAVEAHDAMRAREIHYVHREKSRRMLIELLTRHSLAQL